MQGEISRELTFASASDVYTFRAGEVTAQQTVLMEFQRHLVALLTTFLNSKFRRQPSLNWEYCQYLGGMLVDTAERFQLRNSAHPEIAAENIASAYRLLEESVSQMADAHPSRDVVVPHRFAAGQDTSASAVALKRIGRHFIRLREAEIAQAAYAHGSMGSRDGNDYSDIDLLLILSKQASCDPRSLLQARQVVGQICRETYCYDVLQHHGVFSISEIDLAFYPEAYLPLEVLRNGSVICGHEHLRIRPRDSHFDAIRSYLTTTVTLKHWLVKQHELSDLDRIKRFNSNLLLLPCLYLGTRGVFCYKRESFELVEPLISDTAQTSLKSASCVRDEWTRNDRSYALERMLLRSRLFPQYLIRAACARTLDRLRIRNYLKHYDDSFWRSLSVLLDEFDSSYGVPLEGDVAEG